MRLRTSAKKLSTDILLNQDDLIYEILKNYTVLDQAQQAIHWLNQLSSGTRLKPEILLQAAGLYLKINDLSSALETLNNPVLAEHPAALDMLGIIYIKRQEWGKAVSVYEKLLEKTPQDMSVVKRLAGVYAKNGQTQKTQLLIEYLNQHQTQ